MKELKQYILRAILVFVISTFFSNIGQCQSLDTTIYFFKFNEQGYAQVNSIAEADYFTMILPPNGDDTRRNIREFYKNGTPKLIGKLENGKEIKPERVFLDGDCETFFPNGKRQSIVHYKNDYIYGDEYFYYSIGTIYCHITNDADEYYRKTMYLDCYDKNGNRICENGNGKWIIYTNQDLTNIKLTGSVKNGYMEGEWRGKTGNPDSISYSYFYKKGVLLKTVGYDKSGKNYPFLKDPLEQASYNGGVGDFVKTVRNHLNWPLKLDKSVSVDSIRISFIIEKNGTLSDIKVLGDIDQGIEKDLIISIRKCTGWKPTTYYGVPFRTRIVLPLKYFHGYVNDDKIYEESVLYQERIIDFDMDKYLK